MKNKILSTVKPYITISLGLFVFTLGWTLFIIPAQITGGGVTGIAALVYYATSIPVSVTYLALNAILLLVAVKLLGFGYGLKTIFGVGVVTLFFAILQPLVSGPIVHEPFMATVLGGMISGIGTGMVFSAGGSTGGTDIIASIYNKYFHASPGKVMLACDIIIIGSSYFMFYSLEKVVYGITTMAIASFTIDFFLSGINQSVQIFVFSSRYDVIADRINKELHRGVTLFDGTGWYSKTEVKMLMIIARKNESQQILRIVKESDTAAFISQASVMGVFGEGFEKIK